VKTSTIHVVHVVGSINIDHVYRLSHLPAAGETLATLGYLRTLGGKGANQAIAAARAGARVRMIGAVGDDGRWTLEQLAGAGIDVAHVRTVTAATGHALIELDARGENRIIVHAGANHELEPAVIREALSSAEPGDWLLLQNETNQVVEAAALGRALGLRVAYSAAPFDAAAVEALLPELDLLAVNEIEAAALAARFGRDVALLPVRLVTAGAAGARWYQGDEVVSVPAWPVAVVDTTGAGDVFLGHLIGTLALGLSRDEALSRASAAAALQVGRLGAAAAIPTVDEVEALRATRESRR